MTRIIQESAAYTDEIDWADVQGLVRTGYGSFGASDFLRIRFNDGVTPVACRHWLQAYVPQVTNAQPTSAADTTATCALNIAVSPEGLLRFGFSAAVLDTFPMEFTDGMSSERGQHLFQDLSNNDGTWKWGQHGNIPHLVLLVYGAKRAAVDAFTAQVKTALAPIGRAEVHATYIKDTEHFGFRDGLSNPVIRGARPTLNSSQIEPGGLIAPGELLFGYADERGRLAVSPQIPASDDPDNQLPLTAPAWFAGANGEPALARDFGRNGSFLVVMELQQEAEKFNHYLRQEAAASGGAISADRLGAQMMGRWKNGTPVTTSPDAEIDYSSTSALKYANNFGYADLDRNGDRCPKGAHIRRSNPRDTIHNDKATSWQFANRHRILRRGRLYGPDSDPDQANPAAGSDVQARGDGKAEQGILFMCLNISLGRQFEHVQRNWISNQRFGRVGETDPISGSRQYSNREFTRSTLCPHQTHKNLPNFVNLKGGGYFFLPGLKALAVIAGK